MFRRRQEKSHSRLMAAELGQSVDHLRSAASHAAEGASIALAPRVDAARKAVKPTVDRARGAAANSLDSLFDATRESTRSAKKKARKVNTKAQKKATRAKNNALAKVGRKQNTGAKWPVLIGGLVAAGALIGAGSAILKRRRSQPTWEEYTTDTATRTTSDAHALLDQAKSTMDAGIDKASAAANAVKERTSDLIGSPTKGHNTGPTGADKTPVDQPSSPNGRS